MEPDGPDMGTLEEALERPVDMQLDLIALDRALDALERIAPEKARVVELRYFGGLSIAGDRGVPEYRPRHRQAALELRAGLAVSGAERLIPIPAAWDGKMFQSGARVHWR